MIANSPILDTDMTIDIKPLTQEEIDSWPKEVVVKLEKAFVDARGDIQPLVDEDMKSAVLITSKKGAVRGNHYHETDWHYCYVLEGTIEYYHRTAGTDEEPQCTILKAGEMFFTPPLMEHAMVFPEDSKFLTLGRNSRKQEVYEADVKRVELVKPE
jgi:quercetin dioxygenase-like cupin family protein